jgi:hypothetical protein
MPYLVPLAPLATCAGRWGVFLGGDTWISPGGEIMKGITGEARRFAFALGCAIVFLVSFFACATAPRISKDELRAALGNHEVIVVDDRSNRDWTSSAYKIKGAIRVAPGEEETWAARYSKDKMIIFYCS